MTTSQNDSGQPARPGMPRDLASDGLIVGSPGQGRITTVLTPAATR
jgi:hypothetical protein